MAAHQALAGALDGWPAYARFFLRFDLGGKVFVQQLAADADGDVVGLCVFLDAFHTFHLVDDPDDTQELRGVVGHGCLFVAGVLTAKPPASGGVPAVSADGGGESLYGHSRAAARWALWKMPNQHADDA